MAELYVCMYVKYYHIICVEKVPICSGLIENEWIMFMFSSQTDEGMFVTWCYILTDKFVQLFLKSETKML